MNDFSKRYRDEGRGGAQVEAANNRANALIAQMTGKQINPNAVMLSRNVELTPIGLVGLDKVNSQQEIEKIGHKLRAIETGVQWAIGDWLIATERVWGQTYQAVAEQLGFDAATLRHYKWVAGSVNLSIRIDKLSWSHHVLVAQFADDPEQQTAWLTMAAGEGWSVATMRKRMDPALSDGEDKRSLFERVMPALDRWIPKVKNAPKADRLAVARALRNIADELEVGG